MGDVNISFPWWEKIDLFVSDGISLLILELPQLGILLSRPHGQRDTVVMSKLQLRSEHALDTDIFVGGCVRNWLYFAMDDSSRTTGCGIRQ